MKRFIISILPVIILFLVAAIAASIYLFRHTPPPAPDILTTSTSTVAVTNDEASSSAPYVMIHDRKIPVDVASTEAERTRGLSGRDSLAPNTGLLFVFPNSYFWGFWMKDMKFSIDMIWINDLDQVVHIEKNVSPETYPKIFTPESPALYVIEMNAGSADALDIKKGDLIGNLPSAAK